MLWKPELSAGLMGHLARMQTLPLPFTHVSQAAIQGGADAKCNRHKLRAFVKVLFVIVNFLFTVGYLFWVCEKRKPTPSALNCYHKRFHLLTFGTIFEIPCDLLAANLVILRMRAAFDRHGDLDRTSRTVKRTDLLISTCVFGYVIQIETKSRGTANI